jgi:hypothetical protein
LLTLVFVQYQNTPTNYCRQQPTVVWTFSKQLFRFFYAVPHGIHFFQSHRF